MPKPVKASSSFTCAVVLELFCGTAGVTASFHRKGLTSCLAVDKIIPKAPKASIIKLDLTSSSHQQLVRQWLHDPNVVGVFLAPPCGTASAARNIELPGEDNLPCPLRTIEFPDGLPNLSGADFVRVGAANILYDFSLQRFLTRVFC